MTSQFFPSKAFSVSNEGQSISNISIHQKNKAIFAQVIDQELKPLTALSPLERARFLRDHIAQIADKATKVGFDISIYHYEKNNSYFLFTTIPIWEGQSEEQAIPLSFLIYAWPSEHFLERKGLLDPKHLNHGYHASNIHNHPIPCALVIMQGSLNQEIFIPIKGWSYLVAKKVKEETLRINQAVIDNNSSLFIHRLVCQDLKEPIAISLHGYGAASIGDIQHIFSETYAEHVYQHVLEMDGSITSM